VGRQEGGRTATKKTFQGKATGQGRGPCRRKERGNQVGSEVQTSKGARAAKSLEGDETGSAKRGNAWVVIPPKNVPLWGRVENAGSSGFQCRRNRQAEMYGQGASFEKNKTQRT